MKADIGSGEKRDQRDRLEIAPVAADDDLAKDRQREDDEEQGIDCHRRDQA
ncbi:hypothetical protein D3C83_191260 [compost metagenome]